MFYSFGPFTLCLRRLQLLKDDTPIALEPQVFALLQLLIENRDRVVTRDEIFDVIWKGRDVSDAALSSRIKVARAALGDSGSAQKMIRTVHRRGFQFASEVTAHTDAAASPNDVPTPMSRPGLAVMPLEMLNPTEAQQAFGEGLADDIKTSLGRIQALYVATHPVSADPRRVATDLGVRYILAMRIRFTEAAFRMNAVLLDAAWMQEVWADRYDGTIDDDPFLAQDRLTSAVMGALVPNVLMVEVRRAAGDDAKITGAYHDFLRAISLCWTSLDADNRGAIDHLNRALAQDPDYALAHALISWCIGRQIIYAWTDDPAACRTLALEHAHRALRLAPSDSLVLTLVANAETSAGEFAAAEHHVMRALELDPNSAWAWSRLGYINIAQGRADPAREAFERALDLSPHDPLRHSFYFGLGASYFTAQDYETALRWLQQSAFENPQKVSIHRLIAACSAETGDYDQARQSAQILRASQPNLTAEALARSIPVADEAFRARVLASYRKAGL